MPLILETHTDDDAHLYLWQGEEDLFFFRKNTRLTSAESEWLKCYSNEGRKKDLLIARYLLQRAMPHAEINYYSNGKPYLKGQEAQISISHTKNIVGIMLHPQRTVGLDIEHISPRAERLKGRFLSEKEAFVASDAILATLYWSAKETLFKLDKEQGLDFRSDLSISPMDDYSLLGKIRNKQEIVVHFLHAEKWVMTYALL